MREGMDTMSDNTDIFELPVYDLVNYILTLIPGNYKEFRQALIRFRDDIFLELPETKGELLYRLALVWNKYCHNENCETEELNDLKSMLQNMIDGLREK